MRRVSARASLPRRSPEPPQMEAVLGALVNELADLPGEVTVVLDDYHAIDSKRAALIVSFLLERLPESTHLVISSRVDPPLPLARLRARGQMSCTPQICASRPRRRPLSWATLWAWTYQPMTSRPSKGSRRDGSQPSSWPRSR